MIIEKTINGPSSYPTGGFAETIGEFAELKNVSVEINDPNNKVVKWTFAGNVVTIVVKEISADTTTGAISSTEVANATDLSALEFVITAEGI